MARREWVWIPKADPRVFTLEVFLVSGPVAKEFVKRNPVISRALQMRGHHTLEDLHRTIFRAFGREDEHLYEFEFGKRPHDPKGDRYVLPMALDDHLVGMRPPAGSVTRTTLGSLALKADQAFGYRFDYGDDWYHQVNLVGIEDPPPPGRYPRITKRIGRSPPQYAPGD